VRTDRKCYRRDAHTSSVGVIGGGDWGNPLAFVERLRVSAGSWVNDWWPSLQARGLDKSLERSWGRLFDRLPNEARTAMFVVAADHDTGGRHTTMALDTLGLSLSSLEPAERLGLVACTAGGIGLRHPLLRSVVLTRTPLADRVSAYRALAEAADGFSRSWYLAAAAIGPDEEVAGALVAAADEARQRNGLRASAQTLHRAAELTANPGMRAERLLQAAHDAHLAGDSSSAVAWCEQALRYRDDSSFAVDVQRVSGRVLTSLGEPKRALELMTEAVRPGRFQTTRYGLQKSWLRLPDPRSCKVRCTWYANSQNRSSVFAKIRPTLQQSRHLPP
jgi:hypothetical protein